MEQFVPNFGFRSGVTLDKTVSKWSHIREERDSQEAINLITLRIFFYVCALRYSMFLNDISSIALGKSINEENLKECL